LLIDGLENVIEMEFDAKQNLRWLLLRGAKRGVYVVASYSKISGDVLSWKSGFNLHIRSEGDHFVSPEGLDKEVWVYAL
jgi:hypothetical protein